MGSTALSGPRRPALRPEHDPLGDLRRRAAEAGVCFQTLVHELAQRITAGQLTAADWVDLAEASRRLSVTDVTADAHVVALSRVFKDF